MDFTDKNILVCGMASSGISAANLLSNLGAHVTLQDLKEESQLTAEMTQLNNRQVTLYMGKNPDDILAHQHLIVLSPGIPVDLPFVERAKEMGVPIWGEVELAYRLCPCPIMGITGTNGKTTTTTLCYEIMKSYNKGTQVAGNIGIPFSAIVSSLSETDFVVAELSSFQLETMHHFNPHICGILNITPDHLNRHKTLECYTHIKERIFENQTNTDFTVLNYDDPPCKEMAHKTNGRIVYFSRKEVLSEGVFLVDNHIHATLFGVDMPLFAVDDLQIFGDHNVENVLAAVAMCMCAGVPLANIVAGCKQFMGVAHRIEYVRKLTDITFYNDSKATNTDAAIKSIEAMKSPIVLICGGYDKNADFSQWVRLFENKVRHVVLIGQVSDQIVATCRAYNFENFHKANSLHDAVTLAYGKAEKGDCVLLSPACASFDMFDNYEQRGNLFKEFVHALS